MADTTAYEPAEYAKLQIKQYPARTIRETAEGRYWRRFKQPQIVKQACGVFQGCSSKLSACMCKLCRVLRLPEAASAHAAACSPATLSSRPGMPVLLLPSTPRAYIFDSHSDSAPGFTPTVWPGYAHRLLRRVPIPLRGDCLNTGKHA